MIADHLSKTQLAGYSARTLKPEELLAVDRHLAACDACHTELLRMSPHVSERSYDLSIPESFHLDYEQHLVPYVDGTATEIDVEIIESHIALCSPCAAEIRDLEEFRKQPALPSRQTDRGLGAQPWKRRMPKWTAPQLWNPQLTAALIIAIFIVALTAVFLLWSGNRTQPPVQQAGPAAQPGVDQQTESSSPGPAPDQLATQPSPDPLPNEAELPKPQRDEPLIALNDGGQQVTLDGTGHSTGLASLPPDLRRSVEKVLATRRFDRSPALGNLTENTGPLRGGTEEQDAIKLLAPVGVVIESDRPVFRWRALEGAGDYVVTVHDANFRIIDSSGPLAGTEWSIQKPLPRGVTYSWQIRAVVNGRTLISPRPPAPETRFKVLDQKSFAIIENAKRTQGNSHLAMGILYWKHGLMDAAEREVEALVSANPDSTVAAELLRSLRSLRRQ